MSFAWFPFNIKDFLANTKRLNTEAKGAYLCLMLDYYEQGAGPPDDDDVLATITELPVAVWKRHRKVIAPLFDIHDGKWCHKRIDEEILEAAERSAAFKARAKAGGNARAAKRYASSIHQGDVKVSLEQGQSTIDIKPLSTVRLTVDKEESGDNRSLSEQVSQSNPLGAAYREFVDNGIVVPDQPELSPISTSYWPLPPIESACLADADASTFHLEVQKFIWKQQENGALSTDWDASFQLWWARFTAYKRDRPKPKPRVEVNNTSTEEPPAINWDWHLKRWMTNQSTWSFRTAGPEPGHPGCRVPVEIFEKFGIDPATGLKAKETSE